MKDRIFFILPSLKDGGGTRVFLELANRLSDVFEVSILYPNNSEEHTHFYINNNIKQVSIGKPKKSKIGKLLNLFKLVRYINYHSKKAIIIYTDPFFSIIANRVHSHNKYRFIQADDYTIFDDGLILGQGLVLKIYKILTRYSYSYNVCHVFNSKFVYSQYIEISKRPDVLCNIVSPGINSLFLTEPYPRNKLVNICLVARRHPLKGLDIFIKTYRLLSDEIKSLIGHIFLISHDDLSDFDTCGMSIIKPKSDIEIANIYRSSDIFISTSLREGFGLPPIEAMGCGCATIISDSGGVNEYAIANQNCLMYAPLDSIGLMRCIEYLISDKTLREKLSIEGQETAKRFNWNNTSQQMLNILKTNTKC